jgi:protein transport protein SEC24
MHEMTDECGTPGPNGIIMPPALNLNSLIFKPHGLYLIDDGHTQFLWIGRDAVPELVQDVFGLSSLEFLKPGKTTLPLLDNPFSERVNAVLAKSREMVSGGLYYPYLYVVKDDGEPALRMWAASHLIEDRSDSMAGYQQFLQQLRDKVFPLCAWANLGSRLRLLSSMLHWISFEL